MSAIRKLNIIVSHPDIVNIISELIYLSCFEPIEPDIEIDPPDLMTLFTREEIELENYSANKESIVVLSSQYTYTLIGWVQSIHEAEVSSMLSGFTCAFTFSDPSQANGDDVPIILKFPQMFGKMRSGGSRVFSPLAKSTPL